MSERSRGTMAATVGVASMGVAAMAGAAGAVVARRASTARQHLDAVDALEVGSEHPFEWTPGEVRTVVADDGVLLHVEIDAPPGSEALPTVVFAHGYCLSLAGWIHQRRALVNAGYRCVLWDQRGHGQSAQGNGLTDDIDQLGLDLARVIGETTPSGPLVLVGHSMGGMTLMAFAAEEPQLVRERVLAVAFIATSAGGAGLISLGFGKMLGAVVLRVGPGVLANLAARKGLWRGLRRVGRDVEFYLVERFSFASPVSQETVRYAADMLMGTDLNVVASFLPSFEDHDKQEALPAFAGAEVLVVNGEGDVLTPPDHSQAIVDALPGAEHVVITEAGHLVMLEHPTLVNAQLIALLDRVTAKLAAPPPKRRRLRTTVTDIVRRKNVAAVRSATS